METTPTPAAQQYTLWRLFRRAWTILFKEPWGKGRVSRGEWMISWLLLWLLTGILSVPLSRIDLLLPVVVSFAAQLRAFWYVIRKAQDIGKSKKYVLIPIGGLLLITTLMWLLGAQLSPTLFMSWGWIWLIVWVLFLIFALRSFVILINLLFTKWTPWDNAYGSDPLAHQPAGNGLYRWAWIILFVAIIIVSMFQKQPPQPDYADIMGEMQGQLPADMQAQMQDAIDQAIAEQEWSE